MYNQGQLFLMVSLDLRTCVLDSLQFLKQRTRQVVALEGRRVRSAQNDLQGLETETRELLEGTKENSVTPDNLPFRQINDFLYRGKLC